MKKYLGNKKEWTIDELKNLIDKYPQLGFYWPSIICPLDNSITIYNWNNGYNGHNSKTFINIKDNIWTIK